MAMRATVIVGPDDDLKMPMPVSSLSLCVEIGAEDDCGYYYYIKAGICLQGLPQGKSA
jgi:hypothetical protein